VPAVELGMSHGGDNVDFETFAADARPALLRLAQRAGSGDYAEDVVQIVLMRLFMRWPSLSEQDWRRLHAYARRATVNTSRTMWRRQMSQFIPTDSLPEHATDEPGYGRLVERGALSSLPRQQQDAIYMRHVVGMTYEDIAELVGCSPITVKTRVLRGLEALRSRLAA